MVKINRHIFLGNATENDVGTAIDAVQLLPLIYLGSAEPSPISYIDVLLSGVSPLTLTDALADGLNYLKLFGGTELVPETYLDTVTLGGGCEQRNIPSEYTQVEYLESSGTQYIDTGVLLSNTDVFEITFQSLNSLGTPVMGAISDGTSFTSTNNLCVTYTVNAGLSAYSVYCDGDAGNADYSWNGGDRADGLKHIIKYNGLNIAPTLDGVSMTQVSTHTLTENTPTITTWLFGRNNTSTGNLSQAGVRIYDVYIQGKGHFIPCKRNSDNVLGMYDTVTGNFLTNAGTGTFTAGSDTVPTPDYPMDIWCNNGILKVSPNLFNKNLVPNANEYINKTNGNAAAPSAGEFRHSDFIVIKENTQYYVGIITSFASSAGLAFYDDTKTYISGISLSQLTSDHNIITSPADTKYIRFSFRTDEGYNTNWQNTVYFVEGNQPLAEFMPYGAIYTDGTVEQVTDSLGNTANAEMLLSVGDYKDTQEVLGGNVTRNIGIKVLDGTELYVKDGSRYYYTAPYMLNEGNERSTNLLCSHFLASTTGIEGDCFKYSGQIYFYPNMTLYPDSTAFKQYLADQYANGTPVIIVYPTSSATTETVTGQVLQKSPVTQTAGSISNLPITITESSHTTPTPQQPLDIVSNNGVLKWGVISKNLFDKSKAPQQIYVTDALAQRYGYSIPVKAGTYTVSGATNNNIYCKDYVGGVYGNALNFYTTSQTFTLSQDGYILIYSGTASNFDDQTSIQVEAGSEATSYVPYQEGIYTDGTVEQVTDSLGNTANAEMLLKIGDYKDVQSVIDGGVTRNVGIKVFDGTEDFGYDQSRDRYTLTLTPASASAYDMLCTHYIARATTTYDLSVNASTSGTSLYFSDRQYGSDITAFKQFLADQYNAGFPVIIVYPLATSTAETVTGQLLTVQQGTNIVSITQASIDDLTMELSYKQEV